MTAIKMIVLSMPQILHWVATASIAALVVSIILTKWYQGFNSFILVGVWIGVDLQYVQRMLPRLHDGAQVLGYTILTWSAVTFTIRLWNTKLEPREADKRAKALATIRRITG